VDAIHPGMDFDENADFAEKAEQHHFIGPKSKAYT
jgi:acetyl/propionyl-CoA carboxylase alpha subunit